MLVLGRSRPRNVHPVKCRLQMWPARYRNADCRDRGPQAARCYLRGPRLGTARRTPLPLADGVVRVCGCVEVLHPSGVKCSRTGRLRARRARRRGPAMRAAAFLVVLMAAAQRLEADHFAAYHTAGDVLHWYSHAAVKFSDKLRRVIRGGEPGDLYNFSQPRMTAMRMHIPSGTAPSRGAETRAPKRSNTLRSAR